MKKVKKTEPESLQVIEFEKDNSIIPFIKIPNKVRLTAKDILRIQSQLISGFVKNKVDSETAKTLLYLTNGYIQALKAIEFEERINKIEERLRNETS